MASQNYFRHRISPYTPENLPYGQPFNPFDYGTNVQRTPPYQPPPPQSNIIQQQPPPDFMGEYNRITGNRPNRLAYQQAVQEGAPEIERGKWAKLGAMLAGVGTTMGTGDPEAGYKLGMSSYYAPQIRATSRYKDKLEGLGNLANMEQGDISDKLRALEFQRGEYWKGEENKRQTAQEKRLSDADLRDARNDELERKRRELVLDEANTEKKVDPHTGIEYRRKRGTTEWIAFDKKDLAKSEEIMYEALGAGEKEKALEAARQPGRERLADKTTARQVEVQSLKNAQALRTKLLKEANLPNATEQYKQRRMNFINALDRDPTLEKYVKYDESGEPQIKSIQEVSWGDPEPEDVEGIERLRAAVLAGSPVPGGGKEADLEAARRKYPNISINQDGTATMISPDGKEVHRSVQSIDYWKSEGYKLKDESGTTAKTPTAKQDDDVPVGMVRMIDPDGNEFDKPQSEVQHYISKGAKVKSSSAAPSAAATSTPAPVVKAPEVPAPAAPASPVVEEPYTPTPNPPPEEPESPYINELENIQFGTAPPSLLGMSPLARSAMPQRGLPPAVMSRGPVNLLPGGAPTPPPIKPEPMPMPPPSPVQRGQVPLPANPIMLSAPPPAPNRVPNIPPPAAPIPAPQQRPAGQLPPNLLMNRPEDMLPFQQAAQARAQVGRNRNINYSPMPNANMSPAPISQPVRPPANPIQLSGGPMSVIRPPEDEFASKLTNVMTKFEKETGLSLIPTALGQGRSPAQQAELYASGRTKPGPWRTDADGTKVLSKHQSNEAVDVRFAKNGKQLTTEDSKGRPTKEGQRLYDLFGKIAKEEGLVWGGDWKDKDWGHIQLGGPLKRNRP